MWVKGLKRHKQQLLHQYTLFLDQSCTITPLNPTYGLTATGGAVVNGTMNVAIQCTCTATGNLRWYDINTNFVSQTTHDDYVAGSPYFILGATVDNVHNVTLIIPTFNDSYDGTYNCGIFVNNNRFSSPSAAVTLTIGELMINTVKITHKLNGPCVSTCKQIMQIHACSLQVRVHSCAMK